MGTFRRALHQYMSKTCQRPVVCVVVPNSADIAALYREETSSEHLNPGRITPPSSPVMGQITSYLSLAK